MDFVNCNISIFKNYAETSPNGVKLIEYIRTLAYRKKINKPNEYIFKNIIFPKDKYESLKNKNLSNIKITLNYTINEGILTYYTDGSFSKNQPFAAYSYVRIPNNCLLRPCEITELNAPNYEQFYGTVEYSNQTSNTGELTGILKALLDGLESSKTKNIKEILFCSDSIYVLDSIREWIENWKLRNFAKVKNVELIKEINKNITELESKNIQLYFQYVPGHSNIYFNEICDNLAKIAAGIN